MKFGFAQPRRCLPRHRRLPQHRRHLSRRCAVTITNPVPDPAFSLDTGGSVPVIVPDFSMGQLLLLLLSREVINIALLCRDWHDKNVRSAERQVTTMMVLEHMRSSSRRPACCPGSLLVVSAFPRVARHIT
jgi:hypothetical protein